MCFVVLELFLKRIAALLAIPAPPNCHSRRLTANLGGRESSFCFSLLLQPAIFAVRYSAVRFCFCCIPFIPVNSPFLQLFPDSRFTLHFSIAIFNAPGNTLIFSVFDGSIGSPSK